MDHSKPQRQEWTKAKADKRLTLVISPHVQGEASNLLCSLLRRRETIFKLAEIAEPFNLESSFHHEVFYVGQADALLLNH